MWMLGIAVLAFGVRAQGLFASFVFDDAFSFQTRTRADLSRIPAFFTTDQSSLFGSNFYRPILNVWYELLFALFGANAMAWHALSILLHVLCSVLVFRLAVRVIETPVAAALAAALFAVHPAHVEAISWASAVADPLWAVLALAAVLAFLQWIEQGSAMWLAACWLAGAAAIFTKETAVVTPVLLLATALALRATTPLEARNFEWGTGGSRKIVLATLPLFACSALFLFVRQSVLHSFSHSLTVASNEQMVLTWPAALLFYLRHMFWPSVVVPFYPLQIVHNWSFAEFIAPLLGVLAIVSGLVYLVWCAAGWRKLIVCAAWTFIPLAPALYLKALAPFELVHDRFLFAPLVGLCMAAAVVLEWAGERIEATTHFRVLPIVAVALVPVLGIQSMSQAIWWQNNKTLFSSAVAITPDNPKALDGLATALMAEGRNDDAVPLLRRALELDPQNSGALFALGRIAWSQGNDAVAEQYLTQALSIQPRYDMWLHLASIHMHMKQLDAAEGDVRQAAAVRADGAGIHLALGTILLSKGDSAGAMREFENELRNYPGSEPALAGIAQAKAMQTR
jgi:protein O-mannosyl-transferase